MMMKDHMRKMLHMKKTEHPINHMKNTNCDYDITKEFIPIEDKNILNTNIRINKRFKIYVNCWIKIISI